MRVRADVVAWGFSAAALSRLREVDEVVEADPGLAGIRRALSDQTWDMVVLGCEDPAPLRVAAEAVRGAPPRKALLLLGGIPLDLFPDAPHLPYDIWLESRLDNAPAVLRQARDSLIADEALAAVEANRAMFTALNEVLVGTVPVGDAMEQAMGILAGGLGCQAASFWQASALGDALNRVACTGPLSALDQAAAGDDRPPPAGCDRLLELPVEGTPAGVALRTARPHIPTGEHDELIIPAASSGEVTGVVVLVGAQEVARRPTLYELAISAAAQMAAYVQLRGAEDRYSAVTGSVSDAIVLVDDTGDVVGFNVGAEAMFGRTAHDILERPVSELFAPAWWAATSTALRQLADETLTDRPSELIEAEIVLASGRSVPVEVTLSGWSSGAQRRYACILRDVSERRRAADRIAELAFTDPVTGFPNQTALHGRLAELDGVEIALAAVAVERFDIVTDTLGSAAADDLLRGMAARMDDALGDTGQLFHRGREQFLVLVEEPEADGMDGVVVALDEAARPALAVAGATLMPAVSVGTTVECASSAAEAVDRALRALSAARNEGAGSRATPRAEARERLRLEGELHSAIEQGELRLHYQPVVELATNRVGGVEALVRWQHPRLGLLSPFAFVPLAEETDLILRMGDWVTREACRQAAEWARAGHALHMAVNLSPRQLVTGDYAHLVQDAMASAGLDACGLTIEVTETGALHDLEAGRRTLESLRQLGVTIALDDFGVGQSSLSRLTDLPVDVLKIDRSFVSGLPAARSSRALVTSAVQLALGLGLRPLAEGVETAEQAEWLREAGCVDVQGYWYSPPVPPQQIPALTGRALVGA